MSRVDDSNWPIQYEDSRCTRRVLINIPEEMYQDLKRVAADQGLSACDIVRQALVHALFTASLRRATQQSPSADRAAR